MTRLGFGYAAAVMLRSLHSLVTLATIASCSLDAPVVRMPEERQQGGAAGQPNAPQATGGELPSYTGTEPYAQNRYNWCIPPQFDPVLAPSDPACSRPLNTVTWNNPNHWAATILLDRSLSMQQVLADSGVSKWNAVLDALSLVEQDPVGFLLQASLMTFANTDSIFANENCDPAVYQGAVSDVQNGKHLSLGKIRTSLATLTPTAPFRPTAAALQAAVLNAQANAVAFGGIPIVILITDGMPYGCSSSSELDTAVAYVNAVNPESASTFTLVHVVQLGDEYDLTKLAAAGRTESPYVITGGNVDQQLVKILRRILYPGPPNCAHWYGLPRAFATGARTPQFVVKMTSAFTGTAHAPPRLESAADCNASPAGGFWVTDGGSDEPYMFGLCPCTCAAMGTDSYTDLTVYCGN